MAEDSSKPPGIKWVIGATSTLDFLRPPGIPESKPAEPPIHPLGRVGVGRAARAEPREGFARIDIERPVTAETFRAAIEQYDPVRVYLGTLAFLEYGQAIGQLPGTIDPHGVELPDPLTPDHEMGQVYRKGISKDDLVQTLRGEQAPDPKLWIPLWSCHLEPEAAWIEVPATVLN